MLDSVLRNHLSNGRRILLGRKLLLNWSNPLLRKSRGAPRATATCSLWHQVCQSRSQSCRTCKSVSTATGCSFYYAGRAFRAASMWLASTKVPGTWRFYIIWPLWTDLNLSVSIRRQQTSEFFQLYTLDRLNAEKCLINEPGEQLPVLVRVTDVPLRRESDPFIFHFVFNCYTSCLNTLGDAKNTLKGTTGTKLIILIVIICLYSAECGKNNLQSFARQ